MTEAPPIVAPAGGDGPENPPPGGPQPTLARRLNLFDATMIVVSGIVGSGIFINPYVVARTVHTPFLILAVWIAGGAIAKAATWKIHALVAIAMPMANHLEL